MVRLVELVAHDRFSSLASHPFANGVGALPFALDKREANAAGYYRARTGTSVMSNLQLAV